MLKKSKVSAIAMLVSVMLATAPVMFLVQGQIQASPAQQVVALTERAAQQVQNLIDLINSNDTALEQIEAVDLTADFEGNVTLFETEGLDNLTLAQDSLATSDYEAATNYAFDALKVFKEVYSSIHVILEAAGLEKGQLIENQGLLEAITRELQRIDRLRNILPTETPEEILNLLDNAEASLTQAQTLLLDGDATTARSKFLEAKTSISEVYQYLKTQAEESDTWRISNYCQGLQERIRERFRYGQQQGIDFMAVLQSFGYQSETQFMEALQNRTQTALSERNFDSALQDCEQASQMVQQMEQALNQEINRSQGQYGSGGSGSGSGSGSGGSGYGGTGSGSGYGGPGGP